MSVEQKEIKSISIKIEKDMWIFLKNICITYETSLTEIVNSLLKKYKKKITDKVLEEK
jgi:hypothetical protein